MTIKINFKNSSSKNPSKNLILFVDDKFKTQSYKNFLSSTEFLYISDLLKNNDLKKNLLVFELNSNKKIINTDIIFLYVKIYHDNEKYCGDWRLF